MGVHLSLLRDVMGASFAPQEIRVTYSQSDEAKQIEALAGCRAQFAQAANQFIFDAKWLDETATLGNRTTYAVVLSLCDELLADLALRPARRARSGRACSRTSPDVRRWPGPRNNWGPRPRTLRRQLSLKGTSFRALVDELRAQSCGEVSPGDRDDQRGHRSGAGLQRRGEFPTRLSPLDGQLAQRVQVSRARPFLSAADRRLASRRDVRMPDAGPTS